MDAADLRAFIADIKRRKDDGQADWIPAIAEPDEPPYARRLKTCPPPDLPDLAGSTAEARQRISTAVRDYLDDPFPTHILLVRAMPGTGKTTAAVQIVEELARAGERRIVYYGPRHDFFQDILAKSGKARLWYEWLPRQAGDPEAGKDQTCDYPEQIQAWMTRGYDAMPFCSQICGWKYVKNKCVYHAQARTHAPVIFAQHNHVTGGHPLEFHVAFGDESPLASFLHQWEIPSRWILPPGMDYADPLTEMLNNLVDEAARVIGSLEGAVLLDKLGGPQAVIAACENFEMPAEMLDQTIHQPEEASKAPYAHLPWSVPLLLREARLAAEGKDYPHRVILAKGHMTLLLRKRPAKLPDHVVWLDATGNQRLYQAAFGRDVQVVDAGARMQGRVHQVVDRANGKTAVEHVKKGADLAAVVRKIAANYQHPAVIGFQKFVENADLDGIEAGHFYAARGTNAHEQADALIVAGAPQASIYDIVRMAKMLFFDRDEAFMPIWSVHDQTYTYVDADGQGRAYPVPGFWFDPDLQALLETLREDEILQAAHRSRPVNHKTDIWLLTNIPIPELPPDRLMSVREVFDAPQGVNVYRWNEVKTWLEGVDSVTVADLRGQFDLNYETAARYLDIIQNLPGWEPAAKKSTGGRPPKSAQRKGLFAEKVLN